MGRRPKHSLRELKAEERSTLEAWSRAQSAPAAEVTRARILLAVADGASFVGAARQVGRVDGDAVTSLVQRFNAEGLEAVRPRCSPGRPPTYTADQHHQILQEARRRPTPEDDGTTSWSLSLLEAALRESDPALAAVGRSTVHRILCEAGFTWQKERSWIDTGTVLRRRKTGLVEVTDPDTDAKKNSSSGPTR